MPDRPGDAGPDVTEGRGTRTSPSDDAPAATGPKRPGAPAARKAPDSNGAGNPRPRTRTRTKTGSGKQTGAPGPSKPAKDPASSGGARRGARTGKSKRAAVPANTVTAAPAVGATDPTTEITGLDEGRAAKPARQRSRRRSTSSEAVDPVLAPPVTHADDDVDTKRSRARTTPAVRRGRRVKRVIRRIELWSVLKLSIVLYTCMYLAVLLTVVVLWGLAYSSGQIENIETFMGEVGLDNYRFYGDRMFKAVAAIGAVAVLAGTVLTVLWAALVNIISEITGGIRVVVIEEEPVRTRRP